MSDALLNILLLTLRRIFLKRTIMKHDRYKSTVARRRSAVVITCCQAVVCFVKIVEAMFIRFFL